MLGEKIEHTNALLEQGEMLFKKYNQAVKELEKRTPEWRKRMFESAGRAAVFGALPNISSHDTPDTLYKTLEKELADSLKAEISSNDLFISAAITEAKQTKDALFSFNSRLISAFGSYRGRVLQGLGNGHPLAIELDEARAKLELLYTGSPKEIISIIKKTVEKIQGSENVDSPLFRLPQIAA